MFKTKSKSESVVYKGITFRRYPEAEQWSHRMYYTPHCGHVYNGVKSLHTEIWKDHHGPIPKGHHIHHKDGNPLNNDISNLECIDKKTHADMHSQERKGICTEKHKRSLEKARVQAAKWHASKEGREWHSANGKKIWKKKKTHTVKCVVCGKDIETYFPSRTKFCSSNCNQKQRYKDKTDFVQFKCAVCGCDATSQKRSDKKMAKTCGRKCGSELRKMNQWTIPPTATKNGQQSLKRVAKSLE